MSEMGAAAPPGTEHVGKKPGPRRILIDCTQTTASTRTAGIPRVVRNLVRHGSVAAAVHGAVLVPVRFEDDRFLSLGMNSAGDIVQPAPAPSGPSHPVLRRLHKLLVPRTIVRAMRKQVRRLSRRPVPGEQIEFQASDTLLLADSSWAARYWSAIDQARLAGTRLGVVQYDFIPDTHPELMPNRLPATFRAWMNQALSRADFVAAISACVAEEARRELRRMGREPDRGGPLVRSFRLGADVKPAAKTEAPRPELVEFLSACTIGPYLTVGTIEPRKNQTILLDVFERVWREVPDARLLVAGFVGWKGEQVIQRLRKHPRWGTHLMHFADLSDAELLVAYRQARGLVFPSRAEGYGLPIVESLAHGMRVFASDIPAHREVGGPWCVYFSPTDPDALADAIVRFERDGDFPAAKPAGNFASPTWQEAVRQLMEIAFTPTGIQAEPLSPERTAA